MTGRWLVACLLMLLLPSSPAAAQESELGANLILPTVGIYASIIEAPLADGSWDVAQLGERVGHLQGTAPLGLPGNTVLGGHSETVTGAPALFSALYDLRPGDPVLLAQEVGGVREYAVSRIEQVAFDDLTPVRPTTTDQITLLTCAVGTFNTATRSYERQLVVVAVPLAVYRAELVQRIEESLGWRFEITH